MENKIIPFDQSFELFSRRVGVSEAITAIPMQVIKGAEITRLFDIGDRQNEIIDQELEKSAVIIEFPNLISSQIPDIIA